MRFKAHSHNTTVGYNMKQPQTLSPSQRLRNICDYLEEQKQDSPYSAESWDELMEENEKLRSETKQIVAGAIYDFAAWLTTREEAITLSKNLPAYPAIDALSEFLTMRGLGDYKDLIMVMNWNDRI